MRTRTAVLGLLLTTSLGCAGQPMAPDGQTISATVRFVNVEGGCWRLDASDGARYEPVNLPPAFRTDGRSVTVTLRFPQGLGSFCMVGRLAEVVTIR